MTKWIALSPHDKAASGPICVEFAHSPLAYVSCLTQSENIQSGHLETLNCPICTNLLHRLVTYIQHFLFHLYE